MNTDPFSDASEKAPGQALSNVLSKVQSFARAADAAARQGPQQTVDRLDGLQVEAISPDSNVTVVVRENQIIDLRVDQNWVSSTPNNFADLIRDTANKALAEFQARAVDELLGSSYADGNLAERITGLQEEVNRAFQSDLTRVVQSAQESVDRLQGGSAL